ncbi:MAG: hydroxyacid dehydrogenase [Anaerolineae bacterium]
MLNALYLLNTDAYHKIYGAPERAEIAQLVDVYAPQQTVETIETQPEILAKADVLFSGWGMARLDEQFLAAAPRLKAVFYGAGSIRYFATDAAWDRGIVITSAYAANAVPVSEYTLSQILFALKRGWHYALTIKREKSWVERTPVPGAYDTTVGIISLGMIGRLVAERLRPFDLHVIAYDPYVNAEDAAALGVELVSLDEVFRRADVVSLHTPKLPETLGMVTGAHLSAMKDKATFINTARGPIVREDEMIEVLKQRPDLYAILDVTDPEPPVAGSPLYTLPNVVLTPHIAGSMDAECRRMGHYMIEELERFLAGEPLKWRITRERAKLLA